MNKSVATAAVLITLLWGCSQTPNNVSLNINQGQCVTGSFPGYESTASISQAFPLNALMPAQSPYCAAVTITNNNSGQNANNIQVNSNGLQVGYVVGGTAYSRSMIDFNAAGISQSNFNAVQLLGNIALFDPNNCVTTQGAKVQTLNTNGGSCTFYVEIIQEQFPVGVYPVTLTLNYTNRNTNYSVAAILNQRVNMYIGNNVNPTIGITNAGTTKPTANSLISADSPESFAVNATTRDIFGNVYTGDVFGNVYQYIGTSLSSWNLLGAGSLPINAVTSMASDNAGNVYIAFSSGQIYELQYQYATAKYSVILLGTLPISLPVSIQVINNQSAEYILSAAAGNSVYQCSLNPAAANPSCIFGQGIVAPYQDNINQMIITTSPTIATYSGVWLFNGSSSIGGWESVPNLAYSGLPLGVTAIAYLNSQSPIYYAGVGQAGSANPSIYSESGNVQFTPLLSPSSQAFLSGNVVNQIVLDSGQGIFVGGAGLSSTDYANQTAVAYLASPVLNLSTVPWTPISGINGSVKTMNTASQLTPY